MTKEERFLFDLEGYFVLENFLSPGKVERLNEIADRVIGPEFSDQGVRDSGNVQESASRVTLWDPYCQFLIDPPKLIPYILQFVGPKFRLDHDFCLFMKRGGRRGRMHGGQIEHLTGVAGTHWYKCQDGGTSRVNRMDTANSPRYIVKGIR